MRLEKIDADVLMFVGDDYESVSTAFLDGGNALLVDTLASRADAEWMHRSLVQEMGYSVRTIVATHYMNDHMAGMSLYPSAQIIAQRYFKHTFQSQRGRSAQDDRDFVNPTVTFGDRLSLQWGRHTLELFHNPGKTMCSINIDAPSIDVAFAADNIVGNIVYLSRSSPALIDDAIARLQTLRRRRVICGHMGMFDWNTLGDARFYLQRLRELAMDINPIRADATQAIRSIDIDACLAPGVVPSAFEREWHARNLDILQERGLFWVKGADEPEALAS